MSTTQPPLTAQQALRREILTQVRTPPGEFPDLDAANLDTPDNIDAAWEAASDGEARGAIFDVKGDFRSGDFETKLPCERSSHYESKSVAAKLADGSWVGWTYFYGGGKYGDPGSIEWMEDAYFLDMTEEEKLVVVRTFTKRQ